MRSQVLVLSLKQQTWSQRPANVRSGGFSGRWCVIGEWVCIQSWPETLSVDWTVGQFTLCCFWLVLIRKKASRCTSIPPYEYVSVHKQVVQYQAATCSEECLLYFQQSLNLDVLVNKPRTVAEFTVLKQKKIFKSCLYFHHVKTDLLCECVFKGLINMLHSDPILYVTHR